MRIYIENTAHVECDNCGQTQKDVIQMGIEPRPRARRERKRISRGLNDLALLREDDILSMGFQTAQITKKDDIQTSSDIVFFGDPYGTPPMAAIETFGGKPPNGKMHIRHRISSCSEHLAGFASAKRISKKGNVRTAFGRCLFW